MEFYICPLLNRLTEVTYKHFRSPAQYRPPGDLDTGAELESASKRRKENNQQKLFYQGHTNP
jgi:hypothetical protein